MNNPAKKIIIFDDDEDILSICSYILQEDGWEVHTFTDCKDILGKVAALMPAAILMDNWIPDVGGIQSTKAIKASPQLAHIPVIYFSANSDIEALAQTAGAEAHLAKPFDLNDLAAIIKQVT